MTTANRQGLSTVACLIAALHTPAWAATWVETGEIRPEVLSGLVVVEAMLQASGSEEPEGNGWQTGCPNCGRFHGGDFSRAFQQQRPVEAPGFLISADRVVVDDPIIDPRFVREWRVRFGDETVAASVAAFATDRPAIQLALKGQFKNARPLRFNSSGAKPYYILSFSGAEDGMGTQIQPLGTSWIAKADGRRFLAVPNSAVVLAADGTPVALTLRTELLAGDGWKTAPTQWPWLSAAESAAKQQDVIRASQSGLLKANLCFREQPPKPGEEERLSGGEDELPKSAIAIALSPQRALVLSGLLPRETTRLESVKLVLPENREVTAKFIATVAELGAFVVESTAPLPGALEVSPEDWGSLRGGVLPALSINLRGDQMTVRPLQVRLRGLSQGLHRRMVPEIAGPDSETLFLFDLNGRLLGFPVGPRPTSMQSRSARRILHLHARELAAFAGSPTAFADLHNVPLSPKDESRLAWLGVELQPMDSDLAQVHGVAAHFERKGCSLVNYVFPDSSAARAGLQIGDVLLQIHATALPEPFPVQVTCSRFAFEQFPWERYDELSEPYYDQIPTPWASPDNELSKMLKDLGFGTEYELDFVRDGKMMNQKLVVEEGPLHFETAAEAKSSELGISVREITFETRRYFQIAEGNEGLLVSRVVPGSRGSTSGIKPYEIITSINGQRMKSVSDFTTAMQADGLLTLSVRRMQKSRVVNIAPVGKPRS